MKQLILNQGINFDQIFTDCFGGGMIIAWVMMAVVLTIMYFHFTYQSEIIKLDAEFGEMITKDKLTNSNVKILALEASNKIYQEEVEQLKAQIAELSKHVRKRNEKGQYVKQN